MEVLLGLLDCGGERLVVRLAVASLGEAIGFYYQKLHRTRPCYQYPLSLSRLMRLCKRNSDEVNTALRRLANAVPAGSDSLPSVR
jgi:hypothetical protein